VIDNRPTAGEAADFTDMVRDVVGDVEVELVLDGFGAALPDVA
jgi:hypothetical protein